MLFNISRLSARVHDSDGEDEGPGNKKARVPSAVCRELPTRADVLRAQGDDEQARTRNRRIFGSLLGTLQKFKQEEIVLQTKVRDYILNLPCTLTITISISFYFTIIIFINFIH